jgi:outer membrane protein OmpA-like peptidoglycan-associated protein
MALGGKLEKLPPAVGGPSVLDEVAPKPVAEEKRVEDPKFKPREREEEREPERPDEERLSSSDKELMKREIDAKILNRKRVLLDQLKKYMDLRVVMANSRLPRAVGIPTSLLYSSGVEFKPESAPILELLTHLAFSLGATQVVLLPERAVIGDAKILDMRRTMGISSFLLKSGVAPARIRVNLLVSQIDVPQELRDFQGMLVLFVYNQPLTLSTESAIGTESGPPISLGVSPDAIDPSKGEGSIVEFSVMEPPAGIMSWRFQLLGPGEKPGDNLRVLQEVKGSAPVFHQVYWNGRSKYFGPALPPGRYECVLSATDMKNRSHKRHAWVTVLGVKPEAPALVAQAPEAAPSPGLETAPKGPPPAELPTAKTIKKAKEKRRPPMAARRARDRKGRIKKEEEPPKEPASEAGEPAPETAKGPAAKEGESKSPEKPDVVNYQVLFDKNTANITSDGENVLGTVADTMHYYPLDNINLLGYAYTGETNPQQLASQRLELVTKLLVERHGMKRERIKSQTKIVDQELYKVSIYILSTGQ